jgi:anti-anti-sigma factor
MLPAICPELCIREDVVAVRFPGKRVKHLWPDGADDAPAIAFILNASGPPGARFVVLDIRNLDSIANSFLGTCIRLRKQLPQTAGQLVVLCIPEVFEVFEITRLDKFIAVVTTEEELRQHLDTAADLPFVVNG